MVTTELKDKVLSEIVNNAPELFAGFDIHEMGTEMGVSHRIIDALLREYENRELMYVSRMLGGVVHCDINIKAHDFVKSGGFAFEEALASIQLEKLTLEIESLQGTIPATKYNLLISGVSAVAAALALFKR